MQKENILQHWITIQAQIILNHAVSNFLGHLILRHLVLGEILGGESTAIDGGGEGISQSAVVDFQLLHALDERLVDLMILLDGVEVNHFGGVVLCVCWRG